MEMKCVSRDLANIYQIDVQDINRFGGRGLLKYYGNSIVRLVEDSFPAHEFHPWKFKQKVYSGYWDRKENRRKFLVWAGQELNLKGSFKRLSWRKISELGGGGLLSNLKLSEILGEFDPKELFKKNRS